MTPLTPEPEGPIFQTDLTQTPLPDLLVKLHRYKVPGRLECRRGEMVKRIYFDDGNIIFAATNQIAESLGDRLLAAGRISRDEYKESLRRVRELGKRHGVMLVEMNLLTADELLATVREQIQEIVWSVFDWDDANLVFIPGREKHLEFVKVNISVPQVVLRGVRRLPDARILLARMGTRTTLLDRSKEPIEGLTLEADEETLLNAADGRTPLSDLVNVPPNNAADNARLLYGLFVLGLVAPKEHVKVQLKTRSVSE